MRITYTNIDCTCCKSKEVCKYYQGISDLKITVSDESLPIEIKVSCDHFSTDVNYR